jgi:hypothetical protein
LIYVSLPVHTQPAVIADQLRNFERFLPEAAVVLHVSATARFSLAELDAALLRAGCSNMLINPQRAAIDWGDILPAHLANIAWIRSLGEASRICLHASNDMLVRPGLAQRLRVGANFYNRRPVRAGTRWRFGAPALIDPALHALRQRLGGAPVIGSQVEGSCYEAALLFEIADLLRGPALAQRPPLPYPREEVWLATAAHALGAQADGRPYIFSEVHRFDRVFWRALRYAEPLIGRHGATSVWLRRALEYAMIKPGWHRIDRRWIDRVAHDDPMLARYAVLSDGQDSWQVFDPHGLHGVKRVPRRPGSALRAHIRSLPATRPEALSGAVPGATSGTQSSTTRP